MTSASPSTGAPRHGAALALLVASVREKAGWATSAVACNFAAALFDGGTFGLLFVALKLLSDGSTAAVVARMPEVARGWMAAQSATAVFAMLVVLAVIMQGLRSALAALGTWSIVEVGWHVYGVVQRRVFGQIMAMTFAAATRRNAGDLADVVVTPARSVVELVSVVSELLITVLTTCVYLWLLVTISIPLTLASIAVFGLAAYAQRGLVRRIHDRGVALSVSGAKLNQQLVEHVQALRLIHSFHRFAATVRQVERSIADMTTHWRGVYRIIAILSPLAQTLTVAAVGGFLIVGVFVLHRSGAVDLPELLIFTVIVNRLAGRIVTLPAAAAEIARQVGQIKRLSALLELEAPHLLSNAGAPYPGLREAIEFRKVTLRHVDAASDSVSELDFVLPARKITALVGRSGAGKSTVADLLLRLYDPTAGAIHADGVAIAGYALESWRARIGVVSQDTLLFSATVRDNIRFGAPEAGDADVEAAARVAHAHDFIARLPSGYDTVIGEGGHGLSGGERQRLALARAVLRQPQLLLLDEATSALDADSEGLIQAALEAFSHERTVLVIAHRLSTIIRADQILFLEAGRVVERGSHAELLAHGGNYARYWRLQGGVREGELP